MSIYFEPFNAGLKTINVTKQTIAESQTYSFALLMNTWLKCFTEHMADALTNLFLHLSICLLYKFDVYIDRHVLVAVYI